MRDEPRTCATSQFQANARNKAWRNVNICGRTRDQGGRQSHGQLDDVIRRLIKRSV